MLITLQQLKSSLQAVKNYINNMMPKKISDLEDDSGHYTKPSTGIPKTDLSSEVQTSLNKADSALQSAPVTSVNNKNGVVSLSAADVGALPSDTIIPTKTSDLTNDSGFITNATVPTATTSKSGTTTTLTVTDKNGTTTSQILDGAQGQQGPKGDTGDSGVYVGDTAPTGNENVWIDTDGDPDIDIQDIADLQDDMNALKTSIDDIKQFTIDETTVNKETKLIPNIPTSTFPTSWNTGLVDNFFLSDRVITKGSFIKNVKIATKVANNGTIVFVNNNNTVVYKYSAPCIADEWNIFELNLLATEDLRIAISARLSWGVREALDNATFCKDIGAWGAPYADVQIGDTMTFTSSSTYNFVLSAQWEIETGEKIKDVISKSERPTSGYENFSVNVNYSEYTANSNDGLTEYSDYGVIALPTNYRSTGTPTKLIIFCSGSGGQIEANTNPLEKAGWSYFLAKGYAVMDMNGISSAWSTAKGFPHKNLHYCNKFLLSSYAKGYEYVIKKYNLNKKVFVAGISMGGGAAALITQSNIIPVIANALFSPALSVYKQDYMRSWGGTDQQKTIAGMWDFPDWSTTTPSQAYFLSNIDKIKGFDNLLIRTIGDHQTANENYGNEAEANAYNSMQKIYPVPLKIWHCDTDDTVLPRYSHYMVNMIKNGGGQAWIRTFATGGHSGGWGYGSASDIDIDGNTVTTSIPFYEALLFFERFG